MLNRLIRWSLANRALVIIACVVVLAMLPVIQRMKLAMRGTREQRGQLIRDSNRLVAAAVLSSPKLTEAEIEAFARMANLSEDILRIIAMNRSWTKNYNASPGSRKICWLSIMTNQRACLTRSSLR